MRYYAAVIVLSLVSLGCQAPQDADSDAAVIRDHVTRAQKSAGDVINSVMTPDVRAALSETSKLTKEASASAIFQGKVKLEELQKELAKDRVEGGNQFDKLSTLKDEILRMDALGKLKQAELELKAKAKAIDDLHKQVSSAVDDTTSKVSAAQKAFDQVQVKLAEAKKAYDSAAGRVHDASKALQLP